MNIGIDIMGGDFAPLEPLKGVLQYISDSNGLAHITLVGDESQIKNLVAQLKISSEHITIVHADQVIGMDESPTKALKEKQKSSISIGFHLLASGKIDAFVSAGNTGAMLVGALFTIKAIEGVIRPTISSVIPRENGKTGLILDVGLNADCKPEQLNQFAVMGSVYAQQILGIESPRVALLNVGEEEGKGNILVQATYPLLKENKHIHFIGNIEGRDILMDKADVMICEGFTGNVVLKMAESLYEVSKRQNLRHEYFDRFNFEIYGGTPVLGVAKPVIIGHGISHAKAFMNMIFLAQKMIEKDLMNKMKKELEP
ncbi:MAG TPA: phosphate acyltransferase PlsX [Chitinophagaceae bacterium]|nr:phosphate acyltransferase PlsX [Chitinophagaceae bacterium]